LATGRRFLGRLPGPHPRAYFNDIRAWYGWCAEVGVHPLEAQRHHVDRWIAELSELPQPKTGKPAAASTITRRLSCLSGLYEHAVVDAGLIDASPVVRVKRPKVPDHSTTVGLDEKELVKLLEAADADDLRSAALITLLALNGLRIDEALSRDVEHLTYDFGHRVLELTRKGGRRRTEALAPATARALEAYIAERVAGPIFLDRNGRRMTEPSAWRLVRRLARRAGLGPLIDSAPTVSATALSPLLSTPASPSETSRTSLVMPIHARLGATTAPATASTATPPTPSLVDWGEDQGSNPVGPGPGQHALAADRTDGA